MNNVARYNCSQADLYLACRVGWWLCQKHLPAIASKKPKYTEAFINTRLQAILEADLLPDAHARYTEYELVRKALFDYNWVIKAHFNLLLSYIRDAFSEGDQAIMQRACGKPFFANAKKNKWPYVSLMLNAAVPFIDKYRATLESSVKDPSVKNNMPATFPDEFKAMQAHFEALYKEFKIADEDGAGQTTEKISANNAIYEDLMSMFTDGVLMFSNDTALKEEFTFAATLSKIRGTKPAGLNGIVTDADTKEPIANVLIQLTDTELSATTNAKGAFEIYPLVAHKYSVVVTAENYLPFFKSEFVVKSGGMTRLNVDLVPEPVLEPMM
jgi:hypothetical protein